MTRDKAKSAARLFLAAAIAVSAATAHSQADLSYCKFEQPDAPQGTILRLGSRYYRGCRAYGRHFVNEEARGMGAGLAADAVPGVRDPRVAWMTSLGETVDQAASFKALTMFEDGAEEIRLADRVYLRFMARKPPESVPRHGFYLTPADAAHDRNVPLPPAAFWARCNWYDGGKERPDAKCNVEIWPTPQVRAWTNIRVESADETETLRQAAAAAADLHLVIETMDVTDELNRWRGVAEIID